MCHNCTFNVFKFSIKDFKILEFSDEKTYCKLEDFFHEYHTANSNDDKIHKIFLLVFVVFGFIVGK